MIRNIKDLIAALRTLERQGVIGKETELYIECKDAFEKLQLSDYFDPDNVQKLLSVLDNLPDELKTTDIRKLDVDAKKLDPKALNKQDLESLIKDYEESKDEVKKIYENEIYKRTGKENVELFVKTQKEIAERNAESLKKVEKIDPKLKGEIETKLEQIEQGMEEEKAKKIEEIVLEEGDDKKKETEKRIEKIVKDKERTREITREIERERAEIKVTKEADEIASRTYTELKEEQIPVTEEMRTSLRENILKSWKDGEKLEIPKKLTEVNQRKTILEKTVQSSEKFRTENLGTVVNYRAEILGKEIAYELRGNGIKDENLIKEYIETVNKLTNNPEVLVSETDNDEVIRFVKERGTVNSEGRILTAKREAEFITKNIMVSPKKFNDTIKKYNGLRDLIGIKKLPAIKELNLVDGMATLFKNSPKILKLMNNAQQIIGVWKRMDFLSGNLLGRFVTSDLGTRIITKIGGQATATFVKNMTATFAERGVKEGLKFLFKNFLGTGIKAAAPAAGGTAGGAAGGAAAAGGLAAIPVVGWIVAAIIALGIILAPVFKKFNGWLKKTLNLNLNAIGDFFKDKLNLKGGEVAAVLAGAGALFMNLPSILGTIGPLIGIVFIGTMIFTLGCTMSNQQMVSSLVPPPNTSNCVLKSEINGVINCNQGAPANPVPGVDKTNFVKKAGEWKSGKNYSSECFNDVVNRALCSGINPTYALWAWLHESGASNYTGATDIEDFGMHSIPENENFNIQINAFLEIDPAKGCINDPRIGGDYWLAFSAAYLNGKNDCDPDKKNSITGMTPKEYEAELKETWKWISDNELPDNIQVAKAGIECEGTNKAYLADNTMEKVDPDGKTWVCTEKSTSGYASSMAPATPIYDNNCSISPAYCVVDYLLKNNVTTVNNNNVLSVANLIAQWKNAPANFSKVVFDSAMIASSIHNTYFQCVGFAVGINSEIGVPGWGGDPNSWEGMIANGSVNCPRIQPSGAGVGDFILFPSGDWYHIVVLSKLNPDGSYTISQANWGAPGKISNVEGDDISSYLVGKSVLRCK
ncbi:MAG: hypothetical protein WC784_01345 [Candidatus Shapirobacteria bacterium]